MSIVLIINLHKVISEQVLKCSISLYFISLIWFPPKIKENIYWGSTI